MGKRCWLAVGEEKELAFRSTGVLRECDLKNIFPSEERASRGPVTVIECIECIPCDPCVRACPQGAIHMDGLCGLPKLDETLCTGCRLCVPRCPGLAIFVMDESCAGDTGLLTLPYEFLPRPEASNRVELLDRSGEVCGEGTVENLLDKPLFDKTALITIRMAKKLVRIARHFRKIRD